MASLTVIRAGAGSGKTYAVAEWLRDQVVNGLEPERILATTFTRTAAAELGERVQAHIMATDSLPAHERARLAEGLGLAAIDTVHSVSLQLLQRHAYRLGLSPNLEVMDEAAENRALGELLAAADQRIWHELVDLADRFSIDSPQRLVLKLLAAQRSNRIAYEDLQNQLADSADRLCQLIAPDGPDASALDFDTLLEAASRALRRLEAIDDDPTNTTREAIQKLARIVVQRPHAWKAFVDAAKLKASKRSGANDVLDELRGLGTSLLSSPQLHADIRSFLDCLGRATVELAAAYRRYKRDRGLVDFTDLEALLLQLLERDDLRDDLRADIGAVVVDEFQDTNPIQLAIFRRLNDIAESSCWVGDLKQAIYSFRGADPELVQAVWRSLPEEPGNLPISYRSNAGLVRLVGEVFGPHFSDAPLEPHKPARDRCVERWLLESKNFQNDAICCMLGIERLHAEGRPWSDIAVLTRKNEAARRLAAVCHERGIPATVKLPGLLSRRECHIALAGLRLLADPRDSLAAAILLQLNDPNADGAAWLAHRLDEMSGDTVGPPFADHPHLAALRSLDATGLSPQLALQQAIEALGLADHLPRWGDAAQRAANLDTLCALAGAYEDQCRQHAAPATLPGLVIHLDRLAANAKDDTNPPHGIDAITISTYHSAKGLEWPVVVLTELDSKGGPDLFKPRVGGGDPGGADPLAGRHVRYWPWPFGSNIKGSSHTGFKRAVLASREADRARQREQAERLRLLYVGFTRAIDVLVLAHRPGKTAWLDQLPEINRLLPTEPPNGWVGDTVEVPLPDLQTTCVLRRLEATDMPPVIRPGSEHWPASAQTQASHPETPRYRNPSHSPVLQVDLTAEVTRLPGGLEPAAHAGASSATAPGNAVHAYFAALPSLRDPPPDRTVHVAERCIDAHGVQDALRPHTLVQAGEAFTAWVEATHPGARWTTEAPISAPCDDGAQWRGAIDLLLELPDGDLVLVDHKTSPLALDNPTESVRPYAAQLAAYREALQAQGRSVVQMLLHYPLSAAVVTVATHD